MSELKWSSKTVSIEELKPFKHNPRKITDPEYDKLLEGIRKTGYHAPILADNDLTIVAGHQRYKALTDLGYSSVEIRTPNRKLTKQEFQQINVQDNINNGDWDVELLTEHFEIDDLVDWGLSETLFVEAEETLESEPSESEELIGFTIECSCESEINYLRERFGVKKDRITFDEFMESNHSG